MIYSPYTGWRESLINENNSFQNVQSPTQQNQLSPQQPTQQSQPGFTITKDQMNPILDKLNQVMQRVNRVDRQSAMELDNLWHQLVMMIH